MDTDTIIRLAVVTFFAAILRQIVRDYWGWRKRRLALPAGLRNASFLTDAKVRAFEWTVLTIFVLHALFILVFIAWFVGGTRGWWEPYWPL